MVCGRSRYLDGSEAKVKEVTLEHLTLYGLDCVCDVDVARGGGISCGWRIRSCLVADLSPRRDPLSERSVACRASKADPQPPTQRSPVALHAEPKSY